MVRPVRFIIFARALFEDPDELVGTDMFITCLKAMLGPFYLFAHELVIRIAKTAEDIAELSATIREIPESEAVLVLLPKAHCGIVVGRLSAANLGRTLVVSPSWSEPVVSEFTCGDLDLLRHISHTANRLMPGVYIQGQGMAPLKVDPDQTVVFDDDIGRFVIKS